MSQIVILNMLIAIMAATFARHMEDLDQNAKRQKLMLQSEYVKIVNFYSRIFSCKRCSRTKDIPQEDGHSGYLFVMTPCVNVDEDNESDEEDGNEGNAIKAMNSMVSEKFRELDSLLSKRVIPSIMNL